MSEGTLTTGNDPSYRDALIERLDGADPIQELSALFERLPRTLVGLDEEQLRAPEREGKWSILDVIRHLADVELVQANRIRHILVDDEPTLPAMNQDAWARTLWTAENTLEEALEVLRALRVANLRLVAVLSDAALDRAAVHAERGRESLRTVLALIAAHDRVHLEQIHRIRAAIGAPSTEG
ncbi:MAG: DinB family protein [Gemmatimonadetes bacterium]|nr:DinB family protein [Gemmatimonadota bacterium]